MKLNLREEILIVCLIVLVYVRFGMDQGTKPNPDDPTPGPSGTEKVLIEYESAPSPAYTKEQFAALQSARSGDAQAWMAVNCKEYHVLDKDQDVSGLEKFWQDAATAAKVKPLPNISVYNGRRWTVKQKPIANSADVQSSIGMKP